MKKIVKQIGICVVAVVISMTAMAEEKMVQQAPKEFKNPRLNALLVPFSRTAQYMRITPTQITYYEEDGKTIRSWKENGKVVQDIDRCETIKDEETVAVLRCPFEDKYGEKTYVFYRFRDEPSNDSYDIGRCPIVRSLKITTDKNFDFEAQESGSYALLYSTAPGCKTSYQD